MEHIYIKKLFVICLKFKINSESILVDYGSALLPIKPCLPITL